MKFRSCGRWFSIALSALLPVFFASALFAQSSSGVLRGQVLDPSGAAVPGATVAVSGPKGYKAAAKTNRGGNYLLRDLPPGTYAIRVVAPNFSPFQVRKVEIAAGRVLRLNVSLKIKAQTQQVSVNASPTRLSVSPENNASAVVITGKALQALSDDPDELQSELEALAGPAAGPNGGQIYIDGFTGGEIPPKADILAIHINQNPFSAEYDRVGYGRIDIITKPGSTQFHGGFFLDGNDSALNSRNPFVPEEPPYHSEFFGGHFGGPLGHKASFFFNLFHEAASDQSIVSAIVLNPSFEPIPFQQAVSNPQSRWFISPTFDFQFSAKNVLTARYHLWKADVTNNGIGQFNLPAQGYDSLNKDNVIQLSDTQILSAKTVNQTSFEYRRPTNTQTPASVEPATNVLGAFTGGGSAGGSLVSNQNYFELRDLATMSLGKHTLIYGGRVRHWGVFNSSTQNFNGTFTFPTLKTYQIMQKGLAQGLSFNEIRAQGGGPSQFAITTGNPAAALGLTDLGLYAEDQWRMLSNLSLSFGLRFESQNHLSDHADFAPRLGLAWGIGGGRAPKTVLRAGFGLFYDRFEEGNVLQAQRLNGITLQQLLVTNPNFYPTVPPLAELGALASGTSSPTVYSIAPGLRAPYTIQSAVGLERQISKKITASVTYLNSHGVHQFLTRNINTPLPGEYNPLDPSHGRPFANINACSVVVVPDCEAGFGGNIYQYESVGLYNQNELITNFNANEGPLLSLFGYYTLNFANSNTSGISSFPSNPYDILQDYGRAAFDIRDRFVVGGAVNLPFGFRFMPFVIAQSGDPFNVTLGDDLLGTTIFNQRPELVPPGTTGPNIVVTPLGSFNINPALDAVRIPVNYGTGPAAFSLNLHLEKVFGFGGQEKGHGGYGGGHYFHRRGLGGRGLSSGGGHPSWWSNPENSRYTLSFGISSHNIFNNVNLGTPVGNLGSPIFGQSNSLASGPFSLKAANRRIDFQIRFSF